jgi:hypothetical protein
VSRFQRLSFAVVLVASSTIALADPRPFTFAYDTYSEGKGNWEYEQWVTYQTHKDEDRSFSSYNLRHEVEFGVTDNFDLAFYVPTWRYEDTNDHTGARFDSVGAEAIFYVLNPVNDPIGLGLYGEVAVGEDSLAFEYKLLVQKDWRNWTFLYNLVLESEFKGVFNTKEENELEGVLGHVFGVSYGLGHGIHLGAEARIESAYADWSRYEHTSVYAGPAISYASGGHWWATVTPFFQLSSVDGEPDFQVRLIAGYEF